MSLSSWYRFTVLLLLMFPGSKPGVKGRDVGGFSTSIKMGEFLIQVQATPSPTFFNINVFVRHSMDKHEVALSDSGKSNSSGQSDTDFGLPYYERLN